MELKSCPFCGGKAVIDNCGDNRYFVRCTKCGINQDKLFAQKCDAVRAWNKRKIGTSIPVSNVRSVVLCRDCEHSEQWYGDKSRCFLWHKTGIDVFNDGFCNYAVKREKND